MIRIEITGPLGSGKTTLLRMIRRYLETRGVPVKIVEAHDVLSKSLQMVDETKLRPDFWGWKRGVAIVTRATDDGEAMQVHMPTRECPS